MARATADTLALFTVKQRVMFPLVLDPFPFAKTIRTWTLPDESFVLVPRFNCL